MVNQSVLDTWLAGIVIIWSVGAITGENLNYESAYDQFLCRVWFAELPLWAAILSSRYHVLLMTIERYLAIVHPVKHKMKLTRCRMYCAMAACWSFGYLFYTPAVMLTSDIIDGVCQSWNIFPSADISKLAGFIFFLVQYVIPLTTTVVCYGQMGVAMNNKVAPVTSQAAAHAINTTFDRARRNIIRTFLTVGCCFVICSTANEILYLMIYFGFDINFLEWHYKLTLLPVVSICCINPIIYSAKHYGFKNGVSALVGWLEVRVGCLHSEAPIAIIA